MFAQVYYFSEWKSWGVTVYDAKGNRATTEAEWFAHKRDAKARAFEMFDGREVNRVEVFRRAGSQELTRIRLECDDRLYDTRFPA